MPKRGYVFAGLYVCLSVSNIIQICYWINIEQKHKRVLLEIQSNLSYETAQGTKICALLKQVNYSDKWESEKWSLNTGGL